MQLLNFSVGQVRTVSINGQDIQTAHVKSPVAEPWVITSTGPLGDERAVHPDKLYAYARTGYAHWAAYLHAADARWPDGFFGENLTFDQLDESELKLGDVFALGSDVQIIVAGPRNPCLKLTWRLKQPLTFQKVFALSGYTGVYFDVLQEGVVRSGDVARRIKRDAEMPSVIDVARFAASHSIPPLPILQKILAFKHLSGTIRLILGSKLDASERAAAATEGRWRGWRPFIVDRIAQETPEIRSVYLRSADGHPLCRPKPGQFVTARMPDSTGGDFSRCWSISAFSEGMDRYRVSVRRQGGPGSDYIHRLQVGESVELRAPAGQFVLDMGGFRPVVLVAAGIGITPLLAMLQAHLSRGPNAAPIYLIYGGRGSEDMAFRSEIDALATAHSMLQVSYVHSRSPTGSRPPQRITPDLVIELLTGLHIVLGGRRIDLPWFESDIYLCGPGDFCQRLIDGLVSRGFNADHAFVEHFTAVPADPVAIDSAEVRFERSGITGIWNCESDLSLLELAEQAGVQVPSDCRAGACLTCKTPLIEGEASANTGNGSVLLCIGRPKSAKLVLDC